MQNSTYIAPEATVQNSLGLENFLSISPGAGGNETSGIGGIGGGGGIWG